MIKLTFADLTSCGETLNEAKAKMFDRIVNPALVTVEFNEYTVQPGDTLYRIAKDILGVGEFWPDIAKLNRDVVRDAPHIKPGMVLKLPKFSRL